MKKINANDLDAMIKKAYGKEFGVAEYMEGQRRVELTVDELWDDQKEVIDSFLNDTVKKDGHFDIDVLEALTGGLCSDKQLKKGKYLICFDD